MPRSIHAGCGNGRVGGTAEAAALTRFRLGGQCEVDQSGAQAVRAPVLGVLGSSGSNGSRFCET